MYNPVHILNMTNSSFSTNTRGSPKPNKDNCSSCDLKKRTAEVQTQTFKENLSVDSKNSKNPVAHDHAS